MDAIECSTALKRIKTALNLHLLVRWSNDKLLVTVEKIMTENIDVINDQVQVTKEETDKLMSKKLHSNFMV